MYGGQARERSPRNDRTPVAALEPVTSGRAAPHAVSGPSLPESVHGSPRALRERIRINSAFGSPVSRRAQAAPGCPAQLQPISQEEAKKALMERAPAWHQLGGNIIVKPWGSDPEDSNCHGYTIHQDVGHFIDGDEFLGILGGDKSRILVFVKGGRIAHSGRLAEGRLHHLLIGVGVLSSAVGDGLMGYDARFVLPDERLQLEEHLAPYVEQSRRKDQIQAMVETISRARDRWHNKGEEAFSDVEAIGKRVDDLQDEEEHPEASQIIGEYEEFVKKHPGIDIAKETEDF